MSALQKIAAFSSGGLNGQQDNQRDWSPFIGHFTSFGAMAPVRSALDDKADKYDIQQRIEAADEESFLVFEKIMESNYLRASRPAKKPEIDPCVCFSECTLTVVLAHCEKYGRFGLIFKKKEAFQPGARIKS